MTLRSSVVPSAWPHPVYKLVAHVGSYGGRYEEREPKGSSFAPEPGAECVASVIGGGEGKEHTIMLDLDVPSAWVPSSTPGHAHLYVDVVLPWRRYKRFLRACRRAGIIERNYYNASVARKHTALRLPGVRKDT